MSTVKKFKVGNKVPSHTPAPVVVLGSLVGVNEQGVPLIDYPYNTQGPREALSTLGSQNCADIVNFPVQILLVFLENNAPVITGIVHETLFSKPDEMNRETTEYTPDPLIRTRIDGKTITLNAQEEIVLRCGKSSILLRKDGKVVIKGVNLLSRSSSSNKIKGSSVSVN